MGAMIDLSDGPGRPAWEKSEECQRRSLAIGGRVVRIRLAVNRQGVLFDLEDGRQLGASTTADCCSYTEILHLSGVRELLRHPITGFRDDDLPGAPDRPESEWPQECEVKYGLTIATTGGVFTLDFRNYSNGYYGGWLCPLSDPAAIEWRDITEDE